MDPRQLGQLAARTFLAGALLAGIAACGDDEDDESAATTATDAPAEEETEAPAEEETEAPAGEGEQAAGAGGDDTFCEGLVDFNGAVLATELDDTSSVEDIQATGDQLIPLWDEVRGNVPEGLEDEVEVLSPAIDGLAEGDIEAFNSDATFSDYSAFVSQAVEACDFESVGVTAVDYAFEGVPETLPAGTIAFQFENASEGEDHEMVVFAKNDPEQPIEELLALPEEEVEGAITFTAAAFAPPGGSSATIAALEPGEYAMVCFIPVGGTEDGAPHFTEGMIQEFTVE